MKQLVAFIFFAMKNKQQDMEMYSGQKYEVSLKMYRLYFRALLATRLSSLYFLFAAIDRGIYLASDYLFSRVIDTAENVIGYRERTEAYNRIYFIFPRSRHLNPSRMD